MLLNIIQMTRKGSRSRIDVDMNASTNQTLSINKGKSTLNELTDLSHSTSTSSCPSFSSIEPYRWSILKGNFYYYNVTYSLLRLNMSNVTQLMTGALQDMTGIQFWLEKEAREHIIKCHPDRPNCLQLSNAVRRQLAAGQLMAVWQSVLTAQEASLLANGCQSVAYLLGKDGEAKFTAAGQLGLMLTLIFSLMEDYWMLKCGGQSKSFHPSQIENWSTVRHLNFLLRLPVLLYIKEAAAKPHLKLTHTEIDCQQLVRNVSCRRNW